jgi:hypothetical protein
MIELQLRRRLLRDTVRAPMYLATFDPKMAATARELTNGRFKGRPFEPVRCRRPTRVTFLLTQRQLQAGLAPSRAAKARPLLEAVRPDQHDDAVRNIVCAWMSCGGSRDKVRLADDSQPNQKPSDDTAPHKLSPCDPRTALRRLGPNIRCCRRLGRGDPGARPGDGPRGDRTGEYAATPSLPCF